ncbi:MAG: ATP synthase F1 subunit delta [bacterium]
MKQSNKQYAIALYQATEGLSEQDLKQVLKDFVLLLSKKHKLKQANNIIAEFIKYAKKQQGIIDIEITTARKMESGLIEQIKKIFGKQTEATEKVDKTLLGGLVVKTEDVIFDGSINTQLNKLKLSLNS